MHSSGLLLVLLGSIAPTSIAETVHGVLVFSRHGDRNSKHYSGYGLTNLGFEQNFQVGSSYRRRYLSSASPQQIFNISRDIYIPSQIYASAPDQSILVNTATAFLQGLYPPVGSANPQPQTQTLNNGTTIQKPLNGYQYAFVRGVDANTPDTIWLKGDDACPASKNASESFEDSTEFQTRLESTKNFYARFWDLLKNVYDYAPEKMTYRNAFDIFDLINVARIHNSSFSGNLTSDELSQLRVLADSAEFAYNFNASQPVRSIAGQTLAGAILNQLNQTVTTKGKLKMSLLAGSYDSFLAFFGLSNLISASTNFYGLPDYASTMAFELFTPENTTSFPTDANALSVRFLFRNGSTGSLDNFPLFGRSENTTPWPEFVTQMKSRAITSPKQWCQTCDSLEEFCTPYISAPIVGEEKNKGGMSNIVAGVTGAMVTLGLFVICGAIAIVLFRHRTKKAAVAVDEKSSVSDGSVSA